MSHSKPHVQTRFNRPLNPEQHIVFVQGESIQPGARVTVNGRLGTFLWFYRESRKLKVELDEPLGTLRLCSPKEVRIAE
jgi:hypothetical protein